MFCVGFFVFLANLSVHDFEGEETVIFPFYYLTLFGNKAGFVNYYCQIKHRNRIRRVI